MDDLSALNDQPWIGQPPQINQRVTVDQDHIGGPTDGHGPASSSTPIGIDQDIDVLARLVGDPIDQPDVRDDQPGARRASGLMRCRGRSPER